MEQPDDALPHSNKLDFFRPETDSPLSIPFLGEVKAGFPSPANDFMERHIDLNKELVRNAEATFFVRVVGNSMVESGLSAGDVLVVDRSLEPSTGRIAVCYIDGEFTVKRIKIEKEVCWLIPANDEYKPIMVTQGNDFVIWGIVSYMIKRI